jgi:ABC-type phosphate/phosphonate transport system substrate-binding protein
VEGRDALILHRPDTTIRYLYFNSKERNMLKPLLPATAMMVLASGILGSTAMAAAPEAVAQKTAYAPALSARPAAATAPASRDDAARTALVFSAPPQESVADGTAIYGPIADYLSRVLNRPVVYKHSDNWLTYQTEMQKGAYDLVFDGAHFTGWRINRLQHTPLVKVPGEHVFVAVVRRDNNKIAEVKQLTGRAVCAMASPSLGTLTLLNQFDNPARQPLIVPTEGWDNIYKGLVSGHCVGAVLPVDNLKKFDVTNSATRVIYRSPAMPNQAFSAGPRISPQDQKRIKEALLASEAEVALAQLHEAYAIQGPLVPATREEYVAFGGMLKDVWGYQ